MGLREWAWEALSLAFRERVAPGVSPRGTGPGYPHDITTGGAAMISLDDLARRRAADLHAWTEYTSGRAVCRFDGTPAERHRAKWYEGRVAALGALIRTAKQTPDTPVESLVDAALDHWRESLAARSGDEWAAYRSGGEEALDDLGRPAE